MEERLERLILEATDGFAGWTVDVFFLSGWIPVFEETQGKEWR